MSENSAGLIRSALRGNEETSARLLRTQLLGVVVLVIATLGAPVVRVVDDSEADLRFGVWAASRWLTEERADGGSLPLTFALLGMTMYATLLYVLVVPVLAIVLAVRRDGLARLAAVLAAGLGVIVTLACWLSVRSDVAGTFIEVHVTWGVLLPAVLGLWTANILETES